MNSYQLIAQLLPELEAYGAICPEGEETDLASFAAFLSERVRYRADNLPEGQEFPRTEQDEVLLEVAMAREISHLYRYMRGYFRKALRSNKSVITMEDYTYLVCLLRIPMMTKTELNNLNVMEKTSGTEVINRLLRSGLIEQHVNEEDHRSFYVSITDKGRGEVMRLFPELKKIVTVFFSGITLPQKIVLHQLHQRLADRNQVFFLEHRDENIEELYRRVNEKVAGETSPRIEG